MQWREWLQLFRNWLLVRYIFLVDLIAYFSDGTTWHAQSAGTQPDAGFSVKGVAKLTIAPVSPTSPIVVGDNDPRMISLPNVTDLTDGGEYSTLP